MKRQTIYFSLILTFLIACQPEVAKEETADTVEAIVEMVESPIAMPADHSLPLAAIPAAPDDYSSGNIAARMVEGLAYRYYWATEGLTEHDLSYRPSADARSTGETMDHLYGLSETIVNAPKAKANLRPMPENTMTPGEMRAATLANLEEAAQLLRGSSAADFENFKVIFKRGENESGFPYWNMINGPIADAIYHCGQVASFRRTSGNPMNPKVNVFMGTKPAE